MFRQITVTTALLLTWLSLNAQPAAQFRSSWHRGEELFERELFANAQHNVLRVEEASTEGDEAYQHFIAAVSGLELMNPDAKKMAMEHIQRYPNSPFAQPLVAYAAEHFFRIRSYRKAAEWYERIDFTWLDEPEKSEYRFKKAYTAFMLNDYPKALDELAPIASGNSTYAPASTYYTAFIQYTDNSYEQALMGFEKLEGNEQFGPVAPYYLAQIYYKTGRYEELVEVGEKLLTQEQVVRRDEIERLLADAYYRREDYANAAIHFERVKQADGPFTNADRYQMGYSYYRTERFPEAIDAFNKITDSKGPLSQEAWYYLGDAYLKTNKKNQALAAFSAASELDTDTDLQKEARYLFVKLNYELDGPYEDVDRAIQDYLRKHGQADEARRKELQALLANHYIHQRNYPKALEALRKADSRDAELRSAHQKVAYFQGIQLLNAARYTDSRKLFAESREYAVDATLLAMSHYWTAEAHYREKHYREAIEAMGRFRESTGAANTSEFVLSEYHLAYSHYRLEEWETAASLFRSFSDDYAEEDALRSDARIRAADCYFMLARYGVAEEFYALAVKYNSREADYALLQQANCEGLQGKDQEKIASLRRLGKDYPESQFAPEAAFEKANTLLKLDQNEASLAAFKAFRRTHADHPLVRTALLNEGLVFRNMGELDSSAHRLRQVVERFPATEEAIEAISFARLVYADMGRIDDYIDWVERIDFADVQTAKLDSTLYNSAFEAYALENCTQAIERFGQYLNRYPNGIFLRRARYYHALCLTKENRSDDAVLQWTALFQMGPGDYRDIAAYQVGLATYRDSSYEQARNYFLEINPGDDPQLLRDSRFYLLKIAALEESHEATIELANTVLADIKTAPDRITFALLARARARFALERYTNARSDYQQLYDNPKGVSASEAGYHLARILHFEGDFEASNEQVYASMERTPGFPKWREECLFLLVENFMALEDQFQASYTLDFIEKSPLNEQSAQRAKQLREALEAQPEQVEEQEARMEKFKSLQVEEMPTLELPEEEGEELIIKEAAEGEETLDPEEVEFEEEEELEEETPESPSPKEESDEDED